MVFQVRKRRRRVKGGLVESACYSLRYRFGNMPSPKWQPLGLSDKEAAIRKAEEFHREWEAEDAGILLPKKIRECAKKAIYLCKMEDPGIEKSKVQKLLLARQALYLCKVCIMKENLIF